jgi:hypothetical protein
LGLELTDSSVEGPANIPQRCLEKNEDISMKFSRLPVLDFGTWLNSFTAIHPLHWILEAENSGIC